MPSEGNPSAESRKYRRSISPFPIRGRILGASRALEDLEVRDISIGGVRVQSAVPLRRGTRLVLEFQRLEAGLETSIHGEVVWDREGTAPGTYEAGLKFLELDPFTAGRLVSQVLSLPVETPGAAAAVARDRRSAPRLSESSPLRYRNVSARWFAPWSEATVTNLSGTGLAFRARGELPIEALLDVRLELPGNWGRVRARGAVVRCGKEPDPSDLQEVGFHFLEISAPDQRRLAGYLAEQLQARLGDLS